MHDLGLVRLDKPYAAHVSSEVIYLLDATGRLEAIRPPSQIKQFKLMRLRRLILRVLDIDSADPVPSRYKGIHQLVANKPART